MIKGAIYGILSLLQSILRGAYRAYFRMQRMQGT
jgi:hypothetical protein